MDQNPHIAGRNVNPSVLRTELRENVLQQLNNAIKVGISAILQFSVLENHYGAISTSTTVLRDNELLPVRQGMDEHTQRSSWKTRWRRGKRDERTGELSHYIACQCHRKGRSGGF